MMALLVAVLSAAAVTTWAFLRPKRASRAVPFPALQHVPGSVLLRRRRLAIEDVLGWALRILVLLLFFGSLLADRFGIGPDRLLPVVLVDPRTGANGVAMAEKVDAAARLGFDGQTPRLTDVLGGWLEPELQECSASEQRCLARAARASRRPVVLVGDPSAGWDGIDEVKAPVSWIAAALEPVPAGTPSPPVERRPTEVRTVGRSGEAVLWSAAIAVAAQTVENAPPRIDVLDVDSPLPADPAPSLVVSVGAGSAAAGWPAVGPTSSEGVLLDERSALATGKAGLSLKSSLAFAPEEATRSIAGRVLIGRSDGRAVAVAATAEELGRWAHEGQLAVLASAAVATLASGPIQTTEVTPLPPSGFRDAAGKDSALGVLDVGPGVYTRADGAVRTVVADRKLADVRPAAPPSGATVADGSQSASLPAVGLGLAGLFLLVALLRTRSLASAVIGLAAAASIAFMALDRERLVSRAPERVVRLDAAVPGLAAAGLRVAGASEPLDCERPREARPCLVAATYGAASTPPDLADGLIFDAATPRVEIISVHAPAQVTLGSAARIEVTARVRRGAGKALTLLARSRRSAQVEESVPIVGDDAVTAATLLVVPLLEGPELIVVEARIGDSDDAQALTLTANARALERVVLAGAPSWEARFVDDTLRRNAGGHTSRMTRIGATAVQVVGLPREDPLRWLSRAGALEKIDTVVLTGFRARELAGPAARALTAFVEGGGALLFVGTDGLEALGWPALPQPEGPLAEMTGDLLDNSPPLHLSAVKPAAATGPLGVEVLAILGTERRPWMLGRAQGAGRIVAITTTDLFRLSPPAGQGADATRALLHALDWAEASPKESSPPSADWTDFTTVKRARVRADAARRGRPFLEPDGVAELAQAFARLSPPAARPLPLPLRRDPLAQGLTLAALAIEALVRRRRTRA